MPVNGKLAMPLAAIGIGIERPPLGLRYLEYNSTKGVGVDPLARRVMALYDAQLYSNVAMLYMQHWSLSALCNPALLSTNWPASHSPKYLTSSFLHTGLSRTDNKA